MGDIKAVHLLAFAAVFALILVAVMASTRCNRIKEGFDDGTTSDADASSALVVNDKRAVLYNANGFFNFYSSGDLGSVVYQNRAAFNDFVSYLITFSPSYVDDYCKVFEKAAADPDRCNNMFIDNVAAPDPYFAAVSSRERPCSTVMSGVGADAANSKVRVLSAWYRFSKRCVRFDSIKVSAQTLQGDSGTTQGYKVVVTGYLTALVLSRPLFISFGTYGLFQIVHNAPNSIFASFSSTDAASEKFFVLKPVAARGSTQLYPDTTLNIATLVSPAVPATIYYLTYDSPLVANYISTLANADVSNVLNMVLSKDYLDASIPAINNVNNVTLVFPVSPAAPTTGIVNASSLSVSYNSVSTIASEILSATVAYGQSGATIPLTIPADFLNQIAYLRKGNTRHGFHVCLTYAMDVAIVACYLHVDGGEQNDAVYVARCSVSSGSDYVLLAYSVPALTSSISYFSQDLAVEMGKYSEFATLTSIPNYAYAAKYLGYTI